MWTLRTCPATRRASPWRWLWALTLVLSLLLAACPAAAQTSPRVSVSRNEVSYTFSEAFYFELEASAPAAPERLVLFYGIEGKPLWRRIYPSFGPAGKLAVEHAEEIEPGQFAPGQVLRAYWRLEFADGSIYNTPVVRITYADDRFDWRSLGGSLIDLYYYGNASRQAANLLVVAQQAQARLSNDVGVAADRRLQVYLYNSPRDMSGALSQRSEVYDSQVTTLGVAMSEDTLLLLGSDGNVELTLAHELSHLIVGLATDNPYAGLPRWLDEGLAMYAEGQLPRSNKVALERAIKQDALLTVRSMSSYSGQAEQVDLYYGAVYSVVDYLLQAYGRNKMQALLREFAKGALQEDALRAVYGLDLDQLDGEWRVSLGLEPREPVSDGPTRTPLGLLHWREVGASSPWFTYARAA